MAGLKNQRHEIFAQNLAQGKSQTDAYIEAGYSTTDARAKASRLLATNGNIQRRVKELQERAAIRTELTINDIVNELEAAREVAKENGQAAAMVSASMSKAKLLGLVIERSKIEQEAQIAQHVTLDHEQLAEISAAVRQELDDC